MRYRLLSSLIGLLCSSTGVWMATSAVVSAVTFVPPADNSAPQGSVGGASRGTFRFIPPPNNPAPQRSSGGASRVGFMPPPDNSAPSQATGGASRDTSFIPPPDHVTPRRSSGGASRDGSEIPQLGDDLLVAEVDPLSGEPTAMLAVTPPEFYGLTISARPTIMAYIPASEAHTAVFSLKDESQSVVYQQLVPLNGEDGILKVVLPDNSPELAVGHYYHWFLTLQAEDYITPGSPYVDAWIKRVEPTVAISQVISGNDELVMAEGLAKMGIWYDSAAQLAELTVEAANADYTAASWSEFLSSVGLDSLVERSFL